MRRQNMFNTELIIFGTGKLKLKFALRLDLKVTSVGENAS